MTVPCCAHKHLFQLFAGAICKAIFEHSNSETSCSVGNDTIVACCIVYNHDVVPCCSVYNDDYDNADGDYDVDQEYFDYVLDDRPGPDGKNPFIGKRVSVNVSVTCKKKQRKVIPVRDYMCAPFTTRDSVARDISQAYDCLTCSLQLLLTRSNGQQRCFGVQCASVKRRLSTLLPPNAAAADSDTGCMLRVICLQRHQHCAACGISCQGAMHNPSTSVADFPLVTLFCVSVQHWRHHC